MSAVYYFGCWGEPGHYLYSPRSGMLPHATLPARIRARIDGGFCCAALPGADYDERKAAEAEGLALLHHVEGWTVLAFWDRSGDSRYGSHSTFLAQGTLGFDAMVAMARESFPQVWARYGFEVRLPREAHR